MTTQAVSECRVSAGITLEAVKGIAAAARDSTPVSGLTHDFYKYPARFSPAFARAVIDAFTQPGDFVLDPFAGGGTTLVEALASGRNALGVDISQLATFVAEAKTTLLRPNEVDSLRRWSGRLHEIVNVHSPRPPLRRSIELSHNLTGRKHWRLIKATEQVMGSVERLRSQSVQRIARCVLLRSAQWALDTRRVPPSLAEFRDHLTVRAERMRAAERSLRAVVEKPSRIVCLNRSAVGLNEDAVVRQMGAPRLIVTSPPYPGIHVLYHRWQVDGGRETAAPFVIADRLDGSGASYYTMGNRRDPELKTYFQQIEGSFRSIAGVANASTIIVQLVAFSEPWQMKRYLEVMSRCGLEELRPWGRGISEGGRLWRDVPGRKWHAQQRSRAPGAREVVLIHRLAR